MWLTLAGCLAWLARAAEAGLRLAEIMPEDAVVLPDEDGDYRGWVELHNAGPEPVSLEGCGLSDDPAQPFKWRFPAVTLAPDQRLVVFTTGKDRRDPPLTPRAVREDEPLTVPGLVLWLDAAAPETLELDEQGAVRRWRDRTGRPYVPPAVEPLSPDSLPGLVLWLDANETTTLQWTGGALRWKDRRNVDLAASAGTAESSPSPLVSGGLRYLRFDGQDDVLELPSLSGLRTVLWVAREDPTTSERAILPGGRDTYDFHPGERRVILSSVHAPGWRAWINGVEVDPYRTRYPSQAAMIALASSRGGRLSLLGSDRLLESRFWKGELGEILAFDRVLTDAERVAVEEYLRRKWRPPEPPPPSHYDAVQGDSWRRPRPARDPLNGLPGLRFDGEDDAQEFPRIGEVRAIFRVARERPVPAGRYPSVLGDRLAYPLHRGGGGKIYHYLWTAPSVVAGGVRLDGVSVDPLATRLPERRVLLRTLSNQGLSLGLVGADRGLDRYFWGGDIHEVLLYDRVPTPQELERIENYLLAKWALPERHLHTNFQLNSAGNWLGLTAPDGRVMDSIASPLVPARVSYARRETVGSSWAFCARPTPGQPNATPLYTGQTPEPEVEPVGGFYTAPVTVRLSASPGAAIRYTLDGSEPAEVPAAESLLYRGPFVLQTGAVLRARAYLPGYLPSPVVTVPLLQGPRPALPAVALAVAPADLWSPERGIYALGTNASPTPPYLGANFHKAWERAAHFTLFDATNLAPVFASSAGVRIHGGYTRSAPQKSFRLYALRQYGAGRFRHAFFPGSAVDEYEVLVLRNSGNDWGMARLRDRLAQSAGAELGATALRTRPVVVYLNGVYWGHYDLQERADEHFLAEHFGADPESLDFVENGTELPHGDHYAYVQLRRDCENQDLQEPAAYASVRARLDPDNFLAYHLTEIYLDNADWPTHNTVLWRPRRPDGQWRWVLKDLDGTLGTTPLLADRPTLRIALGLEPEVNATFPPTVFLPQLLNHQAFRQEFLARLADAMNSVFHPSRLIARVDALAAELEPEIARHLDRWRPEATFYWPVPPDLEAWRQEVEKLRVFVRERPAAMRRQVIEHFGLAGEAQVRVRVSDPALGRVRVNSLRLPAGTAEWTGAYFRGVPVELEALPAAGVEFAGWDEWPGAPALVRLVPEGDLAVTARFRPNPGADLLQPTPFPLWLGEYRFESWSPETPAGEYPPSMIFLQTPIRDADLSAAFTSAWSLPYNRTSRSRVSGLGGRGISFLNTGNTQPEPGAGYLGAAVLALDTQGLQDVQVSWVGGTVTPNARPYALRLQYRVGTSGPFLDLTDATGQPVEYRRSERAGDWAVLGPTRLPAAALEQPVVHLRWVYYRAAGGADSGPRDELRLDDILVVGQRRSPVLTVAHEPGGTHVRIEISGVYPGREVWLQSSDNLRHWQDEERLAGDWTGRVARRVPVPDGPAVRYYRVWSP